MACWSPTLRTTGCRYRLRSDFVEGAAVQVSGVAHLHARASQGKLRGHPPPLPPRFAGGRSQGPQFHLWCWRLHCCLAGVVVPGDHGSGGRVRTSGRLAGLSCAGYREGSMAQYGAWPGIGGDRHFVFVGWLCRYFNQCLWCCRSHHRIVSVGQVASQLLRISERKKRKWPCPSPRPCPRQRHWGPPLTLYSATCWPSSTK